jgi:NAD(P)-dependent dehydrogenase (short-subunit alcohol dehydrogenase family)
MTGAPALRAERVAARFDLTGRAALISGGSRGIGLAIARGLAEAGAAIAVVGRGAPAVAEAVGALEDAGGMAVGVPADVGVAAERARVVAEATDRLGRVDILVNNAAAKPSLGPLVDCPEETWDAVMEVNVKAYFDLSRLVVPGMRSRGWGRILNVTSSTGLKARRGMGEYAVSKAAEIMLARSLAVEVADAGITVNALAPILTRTDFSERQWTDPAEVERVVGMQAIRRMAEPEDVVGAALLLASDAGGFITGQTLVVDGGALA